MGRPATPPRRRARRDTDIPGRRSAPAPLTRRGGRAEGMYRAALRARRIARFGARGDREAGRGPVAPRARVQDRIGQAGDAHRERRRARGDATAAVRDDRPIRPTERREPARSSWEAGTARPVRVPVAGGSDGRGDVAGDRVDRLGLPAIARSPRASMTVTEPRRARNRARSIVRSQSVANPNARRRTRAPPSTPGRPPRSRPSPPSRTATSPMAEASSIHHSRAATQPPTSSYATTSCAVADPRRFEASARTSRGRAGDGGPGGRDPAGSPGRRRCRGRSRPGMAGVVGRRARAGLPRYQRTSTIAGAGPRAGRRGPPAR